MNLINSFSLINQPINKIGFDDILFVVEEIKKEERDERNYKNNQRGGWAMSLVTLPKSVKWLLISTLPKDEHEFLITGTIAFHLEEGKINEIIESGQIHNYKIIIYGKNSLDPTIELKYKQLKGFGFTQLYVYYGGLFEWVLLREIYGDDLFPSDISLKSLKEDLLLKWKPKRVL